MALTRSLDHPAIVRVFDLHQRGGRPFGEGAKIAAVVARLGGKRPARGWRARLGKNRLVAGADRETSNGVLEICKEPGLLETLPQGTARDQVASRLLQIAAALDHALQVAGQPAPTARRRAARSRACGRRSPSPARRCRRPTRSSRCESDRCSRTVTKPARCALLPGQVTREGAMAALSRRSFGKLLGTGIAAATLRPALAKEPVAVPAEGVVRISSNENPYGPCPAALEAMREACGRAWRYPDDGEGALRADLARLHGVPADWILLGDGSSEILKLAASAFTGPGRRLLTADPTFESTALHAVAAGAEVTRVPLDAGYAHPLEKMTATDAGLVYLCNPNNPTASLTPKARVRAFLAAAPSVVLVDEAYHHYVDSADYESVVPLVRTHPKLIVARTFSKIYGLAGARLGYAVAQPALLEKLAAQAAWDTVNVFALAAGRASLGDASWATQGRARNTEVRAHVVGELGRRGFAVIPSQANFIMFETRREVKPLIAALAERGVQVGRRFPALPTHLRVTLGKPEQMERFLAAFAAVTA